ncbi:MAG: nuclear transport factor 2 family protein [Sphingomicrobium sp.]|nr:nuclear transport factor 2 family protein [Sphingomonadales bacterium]
MGDKPVTPDVAELEACWRAALLTKDKAALRDLIHPQFELVAARPNGLMAVDRDAWLSALEGMDIAALETRVLKQVSLPHTIIATMDACWKVRYRGQCVDERVLLTDVWVKENGRWQVIRRHSSLVPAKSDAR